MEGWMRSRFQSSIHPLIHPSIRQRCIVPRMGARFHKVKRHKTIRYRGIGLRPGSEPSERHECGGLRRVADTFVQSGRKRGDLRPESGRKSASHCIERTSSVTQAFGAKRSCRSWSSSVIFVGLARFESRTGTTTRRIEEVRRRRDWGHTRRIRSAGRVTARLQTRVGVANAGQH